MKILSGDVNTVDVTKGVKKMSNTISVDWETIYNGQEETAEEIINALCDENNYKELHRAQWIWLSLDSERSEYEWFDTFGIPKVRNHCFACETAELAYSCRPKWYEEEIADFDEYRPACCPCCPITDWAEEECMAGLYCKWLGTYLEEREVVAWQIANLKWNISK